MKIGRCLKGTNKKEKRSRTTELNALFTRMEAFILYRLCKITD